MMKNTILTYIACASILMLGSCQKDFLDRLPQTKPTEETLFKNVSDLETYSNSFYEMMGPSYSDGFSDNIAGMSGSSNTDAMVRNSLTPSNVGGWDSWKNIRTINFMLQNSSRTVGDKASINHFIGIAKFYRAYLYYNMVMTYGDVPWYNKVLKDDETELMEKTQDPRVLVVDSVMADLEYAAANIKPSGSNTRVTKWTALSLLSRISLFEGSYRKYHKYLGLDKSANTYFERAASAAKEVMDQGGFTIYSTGKGGEDYRNLFVSSDITSNKEIIFFRKNSEADGAANNSHTVFDYQWALSKDLMEEFLMKDGTRFTDLPNYDKKTVTEIFENRDPRLAENIMQPGFKTNPAVNTPHVLKPTFGGYLQIKFYPRDPNQRKGWDLNYTDLPIMRYAEVLLNYAEARAELGSISQADLDATIGKLRARVEMPALNLGFANANVDPILAKRYGSFGDNTPFQNGVILEIRRERRIELASEGFRLNDLNRWFVGQLLAVNPKGMYVPALGAIDVTGDGVPDIAILQNKDTLEPISSIPKEVKDKLVMYYLDEKVIFLSNGTSGHIQFVRDQVQVRKWEDGPKYYYRPIPIVQTTLNPNLLQPLGWR
ncbi:RagB/SusD family nutrient uptake outer membrane protein [Sphingobacterium sp. JUb56]|uniref:RagB/SusD family nutrient uptake outer membrane protein n=1 Tax=Sphingobacterium sp. JUb56 TaxID=2587145 RepID=UPI00161E2FAF|nr:RagB/SusD family nutrient uptake outer membrane protein [Sphingobacterium sp. JUb56]MBB2949578.1 hypothetical protein [Sphingobacterium sp. JUb56]